GCRSRPRTPKDGWFRSFPCDPVYTGHRRGTVHSSRCERVMHRIGASALSRGKGPKPSPRRRTRMTHFGPETAAGKGLRGVAQEMRKGTPAGAFPPFSYRKTRALLENLMKRALIAAAVAGVVAAAAAPALAAEESPFSANVSIVSDYKFRGLSQTNAEPALQGGFDYAHASGLYLGTWASSISWLSDGQADVSSSLEWDFYGGYSGTSGEFGYDFGLLYYYYPGSYPGGFNSPDTLEAYVKGSWKFLSLKYSHS